MPWPTLLTLATAVGGPISGLGVLLGIWLYGPADTVLQTPANLDQCKATVTREALFDIPGQVRYIPGVLDENGPAYNNYGDEIANCYINHFGMTMGGAVGTVDPTMAATIGALPGVFVFIFMTFFMKPS